MEGSENRTLGTAAWKFTAWTGIDEVNLAIMLTKSGFVASRTGVRVILSPFELYASCTVGGVGTMVGWEGREEKRSLVEDPTEGEAEIAAGVRVELLVG